MKVFEKFSRQDFERKHINIIIVMVELVVTIVHHLMAHKSSMVIILSMMKNVVIGVYIIQKQIHLGQSYV